MKEKIQQSLLEKVKVKTGSVLKCVELGKNVKMEKGGDGGGEVGEGGGWTGGGGEAGSSG